MCDECRSRAPRRFCVCSVPLKKLCADCDTEHFQKAPGQDHFLHPMAAFQSVDSGKVPLGTFRRKQLYINDFRASIGKELQRFDAFNTQVGIEFDVLIEDVKARKETALRDLQNKRIQLAVQLGEMQTIIEAKRYEDSAEVVTVLDYYIVKGYEFEADYDVKLFAGTLELQGIGKMLEKSVSVETISSLFDKQMGMDIPVLKGKSLRLYNRKTLQIAQLELDQATRIDNATAYCYIGPTTIFAAGGQSHAEVYMVNIENGKVEKGPNMTTLRFWVGIIYYKEHVFAFGGLNAYSQYLNTAEKYDLVSKSWTPLPNPLQRAKYRCSVCEHTSGLYISGVDASSSSIEHYNPNSEAFTLLRPDSNPIPSIVCCVGDELYHVRQDKIEVARLSDKPTIPQLGNGYYWLCCPMKIINGELISVLHNLTAPIGLFSLKPTIGQFAQKNNFTY